eukprot:TRINITY_DN844_c0_g1_i1.p4 TRINITY_DN844_c0_g1~~TRINITY_DN844_c0_g1_i1.p4  ORF type:complete len:221 (+),score=-0.80 TRINITY_DN844_c0_g1_i1:141-803(+)
MLVQNAPHESTQFSKVPTLKFSWKRVEPNVKICKLEPRYLISAQRLLYQVYVEEDDWNVNKRRRIASGQWADHDLRCLIDNIQFQNPCYYFGAIYEGEVVATCRLVLPDQNGSLEIDKYTYIPSELLKYKLGEISRWVVDKRWRNKSLGVMVMAEALEQAFNTYNVDIIVAGIKIRQALQARFGCISRYKFSYSESDSVNFVQSDLGKLAAQAVSSRLLQ